MSEARIPGGLLGIALALVVAIPLTSFVVPTGLLRLAFVATCGIFGALLAFGRPRDYLSFLAFLFFFTPLARRIVDYHAGYVDPNVVLVGPFLAVLASAPIAMAYVLAGRPFAVHLSALMVAVWWGAFVGLMEGQTLGVAYDVLKWLTPVLLLGFILARPPSPENRSRLLRDISVYAGLAGAYALVQYTLLPPWDKFWMESNPLGNGPIGILGVAEPFKLRVFGSMNSPHSLSTSLAMVALLTLARPGLGYTVSMLLSLGGILVSLQRSVVVLMVPLFGLALLNGPPRARARIVAVLGLGAIALSLAFATSGDLLFRISERFLEHNNLSPDASMAVRLRQYSDAIVWLAEAPWGRGFGWRSLADGPVFVLDSGVLDALMTLGVAVGIVYLAAFLGLVATACIPAVLRGGVALPAALAVMFNSAQLLFGFPLIGEHGFFTFLALGLTLTAAGVHVPDGRVRHV